MQSRIKPVLILSIAVLLSAPAATATWYFAGSHEPSTRYDTADWMWQDAPPVGENRIYFAVFSQYLAVTNPADFNPNVGALHTDIEVSNAEHHEGILGVWKDCNGDGYIGMAEYAAREYPAALLTSTAACPPFTGLANQWQAGAHNWNGWVSEIVMISRDGTFNADRRLYEDGDVRVWGDYHGPDELEGYIRQCAVGPQPTGTWQSTGGVLNFIDCRGDVLGAANLALEAIGDPLDMSWSDTDDAYSSPVGGISTFGDEDDANRAVTVWDCSDTTRAGDIINSTPVGPTQEPALRAVHNLRVAAPDPSVEDTSGNPNERVAGTVNHTMEGAMVLSPTTNGQSYNCDTSDDDGNDVYEGTCGPTPYCIGEGDRTLVNPKNKTAANWNLGFVTSARGALPWSVPNHPLRWNGISGPFGGIDMIGWEGSRWSADSYWSTKPGFGTIRTDLQDPENSQVDLAEAYMLTFYAHIGQATRDRGFKLPSGASGVYGSLQCGANEVGIHHGWNCNTALWNRNFDGTPTEPPGVTDLEWDEMIVPGQVYELRDVDCYDGGIGGPDSTSEPIIGIQPSYYGTAPCSLA